MPRAVLFTLATGAVLLGAGHAGARPDASRIVDRTFACETGYLGGVYQSTIESYWLDPPPAGGPRVPSATASTNLTNGFLGGISSRSVYVNRLHCTVTRQRAPLTTKGLRGGLISPFAAEYQCFTPRRVLIRVRGQFVKPTALETARPFGYPQLQALGATTRTELAVSTLAGRPIAYASIAGAKARLFTSTTNCRED